MKLSTPSASLLALIPAFIHAQADGLLGALNDFETIDISTPAITTTSNTTVIDTPVLPDNTSDMASTTASSPCWASAKPSGSHSSSHHWPKEFKANATCGAAGYGNSTHLACCDSVVEGTAEILDKIGGIIGIVLNVSSIQNNLLLGRHCVALNETMVETWYVNTTPPELRIHGLCTASHIL